MFVCTACYHNSDTCLFIRFLGHVCVCVCTTCTDLQRNTKFGVFRWSWNREYLIIIIIIIIIIFKQLVTWEIWGSESGGTEN
jgi:hypothetical protein